VKLGILADELCVPNEAAVSRWEESGELLGRSGRAIFAHERFAGVKVEDLGWRAVREAHSRPTERPLRLPPLSPGVVCLLLIVFVLNVFVFGGEQIDRRVDDFRLLVRHRED
jgi:hypothetical protein